MKRRQSLLLLALAMLLSASAGAQPLQLVTGEYVPFTGARLRQGGPLTEIVRAAFAASGTEVDISFMPWQRGYRETLEGHQDATFPYGRNAERERDFYFSESFYTADRRMYYLRSSSIRPSSRASLLGRTYCSPLGFVEFPGMAKEVRTTVQRPLDMSNCAKMLSLGRVDFFITTPDIAESAMAQAGVPPAALTSHLVGLSHNALMVPKKHPQARAIIDAFNRGIASMKAKGELQKILDDAGLGHR